MEKGNQEQDLFDFGDFGGLDADTSGFDFGDLQPTDMEETRYMLSDRSVPF